MKSVILIAVCVALVVAMVHSASGQAAGSPAASLDGAVAAKATYDEAIKQV